MKLNAGQQVIGEMIELDLQQAWEGLSSGNFDLATHHFEQAIAKTAEMKAAGAAPTETPRQLTIPV